MDNIVELARGRWEQILPALGIDESFLVNKHGPCPICDGTKPFRFDNKRGQGNHICSHHGAGDGFKLLMLKHGWDFKTAAQKVREVIGGVSAIAYQTTPAVAKSDKLSEAEIERRRMILNNAWSVAEPIKKHNVVWRYLKNRGIPEMEQYPSVIRLRSSMVYKDSDGKLQGNYPVMLSLIQDADGKPVSLHRTYLDNNGEKAKVEEVRKLMRAAADKLAGSAVRLFKPGKKLAVAEGIETALAVHELTGLPVWATISAPLMKSVVIPKEVEEVVIFADNDPVDKQGKRAGIDAATVLAKRLREEGNKVQIVLPREVGKDFLDVYLDKQMPTAKKAAA
jgi:putative DNA primase/helicase